MTSANKLANSTEIELFYFWGGGGGGGGGGDSSWDEEILECPSV